MLSLKLLRQRNAAPLQTTGSERKCLLIGLIVFRLREGANKEILGIIVSYKVKVKLVVSRGGSVSEIS